MGSGPRWQLEPEAISRFTSQAQALAVRKAIRFLGKKKQSHRLALEGQPFDSFLLSKSPLFLKSRQLYLKSGGKYRPALVSSQRTLGSPILLKPLIEYSPIERELVWSAGNPYEKPARLLELRSFTSSLFHETNHRLLWNLLPGCPKSGDGLHRYLNFVESLIVSMDMALADHLDSTVAESLYLTGAIYDPGTRARSLCRGGREYRNYLQVAATTTYLYLEFYQPRDIIRVISMLFPKGGKAARHACERALRLDPQFVERTNPIWQRAHRKEVAKILGSKKPLALPEDPLDNRLQYLWAERWFDLLF